MPLMTPRNDKRLRRTTRLNRVTEGVFGRLLKKQGKLFEHIARNWQHIGGDAAAWALPQAIRFQDAEDAAACLVIATTSARAPEITMLAPEIMARANALLGYRAIDRVSVAPATAPTKTAPEKTPQEKTPWHLTQQDQDALDTLIKAAKTPELRAAFTSILASRARAKTRID